MVSENHKLIAQNITRLCKESGRDPIHEFFLNELELTRPQNRHVLDDMLTWVRRLERVLSFLEWKFVQEGPDFSVPQPSRIVYGKRGKLLRIEGPWYYKDRSAGTSLEVIEAEMMKTINKG